MVLAIAVNLLPVFLTAIAVDLGRGWDPGYDFEPHRVVSDARAIANQSFECASLLLLHRSDHDHPCGIWRCARVWVGAPWPWGYRDAGGGGCSHVLVANAFTGRRRNGADCYPSAGQTAILSVDDGGDLSRRRRGAWYGLLAAGLCGKVVRLFALDRRVGVSRLFLGHDPWGDWE
jgi:hypothetical protein